MVSVYVIPFVDDKVINKPYASPSQRESLAIDFDLTQSARKQNSIGLFCMVSITFTKIKQFA